MILGILVAYVNILILFPRYLDTSEIGILRQIVSAPFMLMPLILIGINSSAIKFFPAVRDDKKGYQDFFSFLFYFPLLTGVIFGTVYYIFFDEISQFLGFEGNVADYAWTLIPMVLLMSYNNLIAVLLNNMLKVELTNLFSSLWYRLVQLVLILLLAGGFVTFKVMAISSVFIYLIEFIVLLLAYLKVSKLTIAFRFGFIRNGMFKKVVSYSLYMTMSAGSTYVIQNLDIVMTTALISTGATGVYSTGMFMAVLIELPRRAIAPTITPLLSKDIENNDWKGVLLKYRLSSLSQFTIGGVLFLLLWFNIDSVFEIMPNGHRFVEGKYVVLLIGMAKLYDLIWGVNTEILTLSKYFRWNAILMVLLIALALILNWFFIPKYGIVGTALATFISVVVYNTFRGVLVWAKLKMHPFTKRQLYVILIFVGTGLMIHFIHFDFNPILEVVLRSGIILLATGGTIYVFKIVPDINKMIDKYIRFVIKKK